MKKLIYKFVLLVILLIIMNFIYSKFMFHNDLLKYSDEVKLSWEMAADSCVMIYLGESSNRTSSYKDNDRRQISDFVFDYFPNLKCGDMTKDASHAEVYYYLLKNIPSKAPVKTVIVTMNMRSFGWNWIESNLETPIQKQLVLLKDYPPLFNRFKLAFKAYDIKTNEERSKVRTKHREQDTIRLPYDFTYKTSGSWDMACALGEFRQPDVHYNNDKVVLACHFIKNFGFTIDEENPRIKDFDAIVELAKKRGWNLIFNLMAENVDRADELVGDDLLLAIKLNRDFVIDRYGDIENVTVVDNINVVRNAFFTDQNWTTEHYDEYGRKTIAKNVAEAAKNYHPDMFVDTKEINLGLNHYLAKCNDSVNYLTIRHNVSEIDTTCNKVYISAIVNKQEIPDDEIIQLELFKDGNQISTKSLKLNTLATRSKQYEFTTGVISLDSVFFSSDEFYISIGKYNTTPSAVKSIEASFERDFYTDKIE